MADAVYNVLLDFTTQVNRKKGPVAKEVGKGMPQATKKMQEFQKFGSLTIPKGSIFDAESYSKVNKQFTNIAKTTSALNSEQIFGRTADVYKFGEGVQQVDTGLVQSTKSLKSMQGLFGELKQLHTFEGMGVNVDKLQIGLRQTASAAGLGAKEFEKMDHAALKMSKGFDMSKLSLLFFGMFLQKTFLGIFNKMLNTFKLIDKKGLSPLSRSLTKLQASFAFLGFSIMKSLEPLLLPIIDWVVSVIDWFSQLPDTIKQAMGIAVLALGAFGLVISTIGIFGLGMPAVTAGLKEIKNGIAGLGSLAKNFSMEGVSKSFTAMATPMALILFYALLINQTFKALKTFSTELQPVFADLSSSLNTFFETVSFGAVDAEIDLSTMFNNFDVLSQGAIAGLLVFVTGTISNILDLFSAAFNGVVILILESLKFADAAFAEFTGNEPTFSKFGDELLATSKINFGKNVDGMVNSFALAGEQLTEIAKEQDRIIAARIAAQGNLKQQEITEKNIGLLTADRVTTLEKIDTLTKDIATESSVPVQLGLMQQLDAAELKLGEIKTGLENLTGTADDPSSGLVITPTIDTSALSVSGIDLKAEFDKFNVLANEGGSGLNTSYAEGLTASQPLVSDALSKSIGGPVLSQVAYTSGSPPSDGALAKTPSYGENFIIGYSDSMLATAPYLNDTITTVFTDATLIMKNIVHLAVVDTINDVKLAIDALKRLDAKRAESRLSERSSSSTTNNNFNISSASGTDISRSIRNANIAVPTRL